MSMFQKLLGMGGRQVAKRASTGVKSADELTRELVEQGPEVIGKGTSKVAKEAGEIPDAVFKEVTPTTGMDDMSLWNRLDKKKAAALLGLGGAGAYMMSGDDKPLTETSEPMPAVEPKKPEEIKAEQKKTVKTEPPAPQGLDFDALQKKFDEGMASLPKDEKETEKAIDEYEEAKLRSNNNAVMAMLGKAATQIGGGLASLGAGSQVKIDGSGFDDLLKMSDRPLEQLKGKQAYDKARAELDDEKAMRDPNSEISKMVTSFAQKAGLLKPGQTASAMSLKNSGVNLGTLLSTIEAGNARRDAAALARENRQHDTQAKLDAKKAEEEAKRLDKRKLITEEVEDRYRNMNDSIDQLDKLIGEYGTFEMFGPQEEDMKRLIDTLSTDMAKLSDPSSVARPSEVELWRKNLARVGGTQGLGMSNQTAQDILKSFKGELDKRRAHAYKVRGVTPDNAPTPGTNNSQGDSVRVMAPNGKVKLIPASQLDAAIAAGGKLVE